MVKDYKKPKKFLSDMKRVAKQHSRGSKRH